MKKHIPDYKKTQIYHTKKDFYKYLKEQLETAVSYSKKLDKSKTINPSKCDVYKIIEELNLI